MFVGQLGVDNTIDSVKQHLNQHFANIRIFNCVFLTIRSKTCKAVKITVEAKDRYA